MTDADASVSEAARHWRRAALASGLSSLERLDHIRRGLDAVDIALGIDDRSVDALAFKHLLLRLAASLDPANQEALLARAEEARTRALALQKARLAGLI